MIICSMYTLYMSLIFSPHFASLRKFKRGHQTFCGEPLFTHTHTHTYRTLFTWVPRVSGIANSHELQTRKMERERDTGTSRRYFPVKRDARFIRPVIFVKSMTRAGARSAKSTTAPRHDTTRSPDPSMRKIGVRAHEWAPVVNKVAAALV